MQEERDENEESVALVELTREVIVTHVKLEMLENSVGVKANFSVTSSKQRSIRRGCVLTGRGV